MSAKYVSKRADQLAVGEKVVTAGGTETVQSVALMTGAVRVSYNGLTLDMGDVSRASLVLVDARGEVRCLTMPADAPVQVRA